MKKLCVIGDPVDHSRSPPIQTFLLNHLGLDYVYLRQRVKQGALVPWLEQAKADDYVGFNATMPHKEALVPHMDWLDEDAKRFGCVNTVCIKNGQLYGYNTDGAGFFAALSSAGVPVLGKRVLLLGAGGAAKAVALKLAQEGAERVMVCNRTLSRAEELCKQNPTVLTPADADPATLTRLAAESDLLINGTSLGMDGVGRQFADFSFLSTLPPHAAVCDLIYAPPETELLRRARLAGHQTLNGLGMLVWQGIFALEHFIGRDVDGVALAKLLLERHGLVLTKKDVFTNEIL